MSETKVISARISTQLYEQLLRYIEEQGYLNISDAVRDMVREKLLKE